MTTVLGRILLLVCLLASPSLGQTYPDRNVTIVVTSAAGALTDVLTRRSCTAVVGKSGSEA